jgi:hypothetical protein
MAGSNARRAREAREAIDEDSVRTISEFKAARDKIWATPPFSPGFTAVLNSYKAARNAKDKLLIAEYGMVLPAIAINNSRILKSLDEKYLVPEAARESSLSSH